MTFNLTIHATSDVGLKRKNNEDSFGVFTSGGTTALCCGGVPSGAPFELGETMPGASSGIALPVVSTGCIGNESKDWLVLVCDGMGGVDGGEVASEIGVRSMADWYQAFCKTSGTDLDGGGVEGTPSDTTREVVLAPHAASLSEAVHAADRAVWDRAQSDEKLRGMGATLSALWIAHGRYVTAQVGDSRVYLWRDGKLTQLTEDQTVLNRLLKDGKTPASQAVASRFKSTLEQSLGSEPGLLKPVMQAGEVVAGDLFLVCSDGLYDGMDEADLTTLLRRQAGRMPLQKLCERLVSESVKRSGRDNTTAVMVAAGEVRPVGGVFGKFF